jgi:hypothetical protein
LELVKNATAKTAAAAAAAAAVVITASLAVVLAHLYQAAKHSRESSGSGYTTFTQMHAMAYLCIAVHSSTL